MATHTLGTREEWLAARLDLLNAEKELTRRSDELAQQRRDLPWVRVEKEYRFDTDEGRLTLAELFRGRSQLLVYHFMFGPDYTAGCPSCSAIADGFNGVAVHLANHDVTLSAVSSAPLAKLLPYRERMGWTFPWASSLDSTFNADFNVRFTEAQQREGAIDYNYRRERAWTLRGGDSPVAAIAAMTGTDAATYTRERPGMSAFVLEDGIVYHTYSTYARGLDGLWGMYQWLDRAPRGRNETGVWWRRHDEYRAVKGMPVASTEPHGCSSRDRSRDAGRGGEAFWTACGLLFASCATLTIASCTAMSSGRGMPMPGGWTMSMMWMRMPGQTWPAAAAAFLGAWMVMTVAMMLPSVAPALWRYRRAAAASGAMRVGLLTGVFGAGYFFVWSVWGIAVFSFGATLASIEMDHPPLARVVPTAAGVVVLIAGAAQFTSWKAHHLTCCRTAPLCAWRALPRSAPACQTSRQAWQDGMRLGRHCSACCAGLTAILLVLGVMDLGVTAAVTAAMTLERLAPGGARVARAIGAVIVTAGLILIARAA